MDSLEYKQTPFEELEWWFATFKQENILGSPEEKRVIQSALGKQVITFDSDPRNAVTSFKKLTRDPTFGTLLSRAYHTVILRPGNRSRTQRQPGGLTQDKFFRYVAAILPHMRNVKEFILLDSSVDSAAASAHDLFESKNNDAYMQLETLWCNSEALLARCWSSLSNGRALIKLQDFRGFCDTHRPPPSQIVPLVTPELKYLETSAHFALRLQIPWRITHLCVHVEWSELPSILRKISTLPGLSNQLHALRLNCYTQAEKQPAGSGATLGRKSSPLAVHWPGIVCRNLDVQTLNYLEIKEVTPYDGASGPVFPNGPRNGANGTPSLKRIAWRPAWNEAISRQSGKEIRAAVDAIFSRALTVDFIAIALDRNDAGPWRVFTRDSHSGRVEDAERTQAINELSWKVTEWVDARRKRWHWPKSSRLYTQDLLTSWSQSHR